MEKTKRDKIISQIRIQEKIQSAGFNIVECGHCGSILLHECGDELIECVYCDKTLSLSDCPDYLYSGMENNQEFQ